MRTLFRILIFLLPTQLALHLWPNWAFVYGIRSDYLSPTISFVDIILAVWIALFILVNRYKVYSSLLKHRHFVGILVAIAMTNILFAQIPIVALFGWVTSGKLILFGWIVSLSEIDFKKDILIPISFSLIAFASIGLLQFIESRSLGGILYYFGERTFSKYMPGIATYQLGGFTFLRAYSVFSHPNSFAGYLGVCLILLGVYLRKDKKLIYKIAFVFGVLALTITFSANAIIVYVLTWVVSKIYSPTLGVFKGWFKNVLVTIIAFSIIFPVISKITLSGINVSLPKSIYERLELGSASGFLFSRSPLVGVGARNFVPMLPSLQVRPELLWTLQPVHNLVLLLLTETGTSGVLLFGYIIFQVVSKLGSGNLYTRLGISLIFILITGLFDHYWLTLEQNQLMFSLICGLAVSKNIQE